MPFSRFILFSSTRRFTRDVFRLFPRLEDHFLNGNLLEHFRFSPSKRVRSFSCTKSSERSRGKPDAPYVVHSESHTSHTPATYVIPAAMLGFAGIVAFLHYNDERRAVHKGQADCRRANTAGGPIIGGPFTLIDTEKRTVTEHNFLGNWVLLYFGYTSSPDLGPDLVNVMAKTIDILESKQNVKILPVFVTIDPQRDTPSQLREYLKEFDSRIIGLTGPVGAIRQMAQEYRVYFKKVEEEEGGDYLVDSSHNMYLLNPKMEVERCFGVEYNADDLSKEILKEMKGKAS